MGLVVHSSNNLEPPLSTSDERIFVVPPHGKVVVKSRDFKLIYFLKASGRLCIDDKYAFDLKDGDLIVFPNPCEHFYINNSPNSIAQIHAFRLVLQAKDEISRLPDNSEKTFCLENFTEPRQVSALHSPGIIDSINLIRRELEEQATGWTLAVNSAAFQFLVSAARALQSGNLSPEERKAPARFLIVNNAREFIHKNYHRPITLGETALHVGWGEEHLAREFKKTLGITVFQYLRQTRINAAIGLMTDSNYSLTRIATLTGFNTLAFFSRCFRETTGKPPSKYRSELPSQLILPEGQHRYEIF